MFALALAIAMSSFVVTQPANHERVLVTGATGEGKSFYVRQFIDGNWRTLIFDPEGEFSAYRWMHVDELEVRWREFRFGTLQLAIRERPGKPVFGKHSEHERFCAAALRIASYGSPLLTVHEEASAWAEGPSPSTTGYYFSRLTTRGRKRGNSMLVTAQRLHQVPTVYRDNLSRLIAYQVPNEEAVQALRKILGPDAPLIDQLGTHEFIDWTRRERARIRRPLAAL